MTSPPMKTTVIYDIYDTTWTFLWTPTASGLINLTGKDFWSYNQVLSSLCVVKHNERGHAHAQTHTLHCVC